MDGVGTALSVNPRLDAANRREQAARLREELAQLESLDQSSANVPPPHLEILPIGRPVRK